MQLSHIWHCPRPALAQSFLRLLGSGLVTSTSLFAPRRTGKTVFLRQDLTPAAVAAGYLVAYADLWQTRNSPGIALIRGLEEALEAKGLAQRALKALRTPVRKLKASASVPALKGEFELELTDPDTAATEMALRIEQLVAQLVKKKPLLLLVDEAQELARNKDNELMATALRTAMTKHRDKMRVVFTGSSRSQLAHVFSSAQAPLYSVGATVQDFPLLGREFVEFVAQKFELACGRQLDVALAWKLFERLFHQMPEPFLSAVVALLMNPALTLQAACEQQMAEDARLENHEATWTQLDALQQELVLLLRVHPDAALFSKDNLRTMGKRVGRKGPVPASSVQYALSGLAQRNILSKSARGAYEFDNPAFAHWVQACVVDESSQTASDDPAGA